MVLGKKRKSWHKTGKKKNDSQAKGQDGKTAWRRVAPANDSERGRVFRGGKMGEKTGVQEGEENHHNRLVNHPKRKKTWGAGPKKENENSTRKGSGRTCKKSL